MYGCGASGHNHKCPPRTPTPEETARIIASYERAILVMYGSDNPACANINRDLVALEREIFLDGYERAAAFGVGPCSLCENCDVSKPCPRPGETRPALEACGIDVYTTFSRAGVRLEVVRDYESPFKLCGAILVE
jgi:predicted metal-binding protein